MAASDHLNPSQFSMSTTPASHAIVSSHNTPGKGHQGEVYERGTVTKTCGHWHGDSGSAESCMKSM